MKIRYFNMATAQGVETVDELSQKDFKNHREFILELRRLKSEYNISGMVIYTSQRCTNEWKNR